MATFDTFKTDFLLALRADKEGDTAAYTGKNLAMFSSNFAHLFELVEGRVGTLDYTETKLITVYGNNTRRLQVTRTVTAVTKLEIKTSDSDSWTEISTDDWVFNSTLGYIDAYDTSDPFWNYNVVGGNIRITATIGYEAWADIPTIIRTNIINCARNYLQMLERTNSTLPDGVQAKQETNFNILRQAMDQWFPYPHRIGVFRAG